MTDIFTNDELIKTRNQLLLDLQEANRSVDGIFNGKSAKSIKRKLAALRKEINSNFAKWIVAKFSLSIVEDRMADGDLIDEDEDED